MLVAIGQAAMITTLLCGKPQPPLLPPASSVKTERQAVTRAMKAALKVYGRKVIQSELPLVATKDGEGWIVHGTMPKPPPGLFSVGGVVEVRINGSDGLIVAICHGE